MDSSLVWGEMRSQVSLQITNDESTWCGDIQVKATPTCIDSHQNKH